MLQPALHNRIFSQVSKLLWLRSTKRFSDNATDNSNKNESAIDSSKSNLEEPSDISVKNDVQDDIQNDIQKSQIETDANVLCNQNASEFVQEPIKNDPSLSTDNAKLNENKISELLSGASSYENVNNKDWLTTPYPQNAPTTPNLETYERRFSPENTTIILFPGQGTIKVGTVQKYLRFPRVKQMFSVANEILGYNLLKICLEGPQEKLNRTHFNQPATVVCSLAALEQLVDDRPHVLKKCVATAGYSVGEITSLIFSGVLSFEDGIKLVSIRGTAMQFASERVPQGMLSIYCRPNATLGSAYNEAKAWARNAGVENPVCSTAIYLHTQNKIIGGHEATLQCIQHNKEKFGFSRLQRLPVSGAFHTKLMEPSLKAFCRILDQIEFDQPRVPTYSNFSAVPYAFNQKIIRKYLIKQIISPVKWEQIMHTLYKRPEGIPFPKTYDVGSHGRMKTILALINRKAADNCTIVN